MSLSRIVIRLARNPGTEFADGDDHRGYSFIAPLDPAGKIDLSAFQKSRSDCAVRRFAPEQDAVTGKLAHRRSSWYFDYDDQSDADDEAVHRLGDHSFAVGEYVSVADEDGRLLAYKVTEVAPI
ncbi:MAG: hypothetical protein QE280_14290 [Caulobacter sp.]|jgi:hypothetical protein|nr:hypothetical protein [Caulobacter sp.]